LSVSPRLLGPPLPGLVTKSQNSGSNTLQFLVDGDTKVEGKLAVGAQATVEYRGAEGKYIATRVVVTPASGMNLY
jgi:hypothetical protein